jgi:hypothetical protein
MLPIHNQLVINITQYRSVIISNYSVIKNIKMAGAITIADVVDVICDRFELETHDVLAYVKAMLECSSDAVIHSNAVKKLVPMKDCTGCLFDPVSRKLYSEIAVE